MKRLFKILLLAAVTAAVCFAVSACAGDAERQAYDSGASSAQDSENGTSLGSFTSTDLEGNQVTEAIFAEHDVTIFNVWGTYCGPCMEEMPDLGALDQKLPDNVQIVGVVLDAAEGDAAMIETAKQICRDTNVAYTNILMNESVAEMLSGVEAIPTTFILDREGKLICTPIVGADVERYEKTVQDYLNRAD